MRNVNLTIREHQILTLSIQGLNTAQIADRLCVTDQLVNEFKERVKRKLHGSKEQTFESFINERYGSVSREDRSVLLSLL